MLKISFNFDVEEMLRLKSTKVKNLNCTPICIIGRDLSARIFHGPNVG